ncbi:MAG TPA: hypothetical protein VGL39_28285 [Jatrophihabitantaceae bacterium]|jgi:predicted lipoprotein with Yx(FWY)xxD motif
MIKQLVLVAGTAGALALTACSSSGNKSGSSTTPPPPASSTTSSPPSSTPVGGAVAVSVAKTSKGDALVGPNGHVLYTYDPDTATKSSCDGGCATAWPPLVGTSQPGSGLDASEFGTITRSDGSMQVTYDHHPLYYFAKDADSEDVYGDGVGGTWHLAKHAEASSSSSSANDGY